MKNVPVGRKPICLSACYPEIGVVRPVTVGSARGPESGGTKLLKTTDTRKQLQGEQQAIDKMVFCFQDYELLHKRAFIQWNIIDHFLFSHHLERALSTV